MGGREGARLGLRARPSQAAIARGLLGVTSEPDYFGFGWGVGPGFRVSSFQQVLGLASSAAVVETSAKKQSVIKAFQGTARRCSER